MSIKRLNRFGAAVRDLRLLRLIGYAERYNIIERCNTDKHNTDRHNTKRSITRLYTAILFLLLFVSGCSGRSSAPVLETYPPVEISENECSIDSRTGLSEKQPKKQEPDGAEGRSEEQSQKQKNS